ncbi:MAG: LamG domain-containing protein [Thermoleophilia bacterium]
MSRRSLTHLACACAFACAALLPATASAATNLGGAWHFDEPGGATAVDSSGNANHATLAGDPARIPGRFGGSLRFDGIDDRATVPRSSSLEPANVTVETWLRAPASPGQYRHIISQGATGCGTASWGLYTGAQNGLQFYIASADAFGSWAISPDAGQGLWDGAWHHVAGTFDGATVRLFVDGVQVGDGTPTELAIVYPFDVADTYFGVFGGCSLLNYAGDLDEPRVWRRALSSEELAASVAMGDPATRRLGERVDSTQAIVHSSEFDGGDVKISTESSTGTEKIKSIRLVGLLPLTTRATCSDGLLALLNSSCDYALSNGDRTARVRVRPLLGRPVATLRVTVTSGRTFDVKVDTGA